MGDSASVATSTATGKGKGTASAHIPLSAAARAEGGSLSSNFSRSCPSSFSISRSASSFTSSARKRKCERSYLNSHVFVQAPTEQYIVAAVHPHCCINSVLLAGQMRHLQPRLACRGGEPRRTGLCPILRNSHQSPHPKQPATAV
eukprot:813461-Rhodomonas_salina.1